MDFDPMLNYVVNGFLFSIPALMLAARLPRRPLYYARAALSIALIIFYLTNPFASLIKGDTIAVFTAMTLYFATILILLLAMVLFVTESTLWAAAFCAVVGYTVENLGASFGELLGQLLRMARLNVGLFSNAFFRSVLCCAIIYALFYVIVIRRMRNKALEIDPSKTSFVLVFGVVLINIVFDMAVKYVRAYSVPTGFSLIFRTVQIAVCFYALMLEFEMIYNRHLILEAATTERILHDREQQYALSRENIEAINIKCHDIRHQIRHIEDDNTDTRVVDKTVLDDIAHQVSIYDSTVHTGNNALDTILTEKSLLGEREHITLGCIVDGHALDFMSDTDLYSLFGNALDNAFEAVRALEDEDERNISLLVKQAAGMVSIHIENYYAGDVRFENGIPVTTKEDKRNHGYGIKSMHIITQRYGGSLTMGTEDQTFYLNVLIPVPKP